MSQPHDIHFNTETTTITLTLTLLLSPVWRLLDSLYELSFHISTFSLFTFRKSPSLIPPPPSSTKVNKWEQDLGLETLPMYTLIERATETINLIQEEIRLTSICIIILFIAIYMDCTNLSQICTRATNWIFYLVSLKISYLRFINSSGNTISLLTSSQYFLKRNLHL